MRSSLSTWFALLCPTFLPAQILLPADPTPAYAGKPYSAGPLRVIGGGACPANRTRLEIVDGSLPAGIRLSAAGYFSGQASVPGSFPFTLRASNACGYRDQQLTIRVLPPPVLKATLTSIDKLFHPGEPAPEPIAFRVTTTEGEIPYSIDAPVRSWLSVRPAAGIASPAGDPVELALDPTRLLPGRQTIALWITAWHAKKPALVTLTVELSTPAPQPTPSPVSTTLTFAPIPEIVIPPLPKPPPEPEPTRSAPLRTPRPRFGYRGPARTAAAK